MAWWSQQFLGITAIALWLTLLAFLAIQVRRRWHGQREWSRKLVHMGTGLVVLIAWACAIDRRIALPAAALITLLALLNHRLRVLPAIEDVGRSSYGTVAYGASITILLAIYWPSRPDAVAAGVLVMAIGDGLAGLIGPLIPSPCWQVLGQRKSLVGTGAMAAGSLGVLLLLRQLAGVEGLAAPNPAALGAIVLVSVLLEQLAILGIDNLTVPIAAGWLWSLLSQPLGQG
ncbi:diacylglycerol/polyprenol kinase family protein [Cyanobium sp. WAJ14-Wanaka]|uniref:diacylglycerol/polyprenol kinase family protein n=1 Tax=Cyanobium sp. WAJ14-Wanaka TaxID=2823725 RepID=UPI0020CE2EE8|nr:dolichol kinase [Cyanobium sp. WAJ14-Wanaka]MCP9775519.1 dolichol kinase [Cyanobium sp. WAJ14-Wanaka]